jgi:hypothetical protein
VLIFQDVPIRNWAQLQAWDTLALRLEGRLNPILVPLCERPRQPRPPPGGEPEAVTVPHDDLSPFADVTYYAAPTLAAEVFADAPMRATTIRIEAINLGAPEPAHFFSIGERLYQIRSVDAVAGAVYTVSFRPPLREAVTAGSPVDFENMVCKMKLASDREMDRVLTTNRLGQQTVNFIEDTR